MPIYDYVCTACDHRADILHGINDPGPNFCPSCGREGTMRKLFSAPSIHFKGSGWAKKDRGGGGKPASKSPAASTTSTPADSTSSSPASTNSSPDSKD